MPPWRRCFSFTDALLKSVRAASAAARRCAWRNRIAIAQLEEVQGELTLTIIRPASTQLRIQAQTSSQNDPPKLERPSAPRPNPQVLLASYVLPLKTDAKTEKVIK